MTEHGFADIRACVFDAYGTIFDLVSATNHESAVLGPQAAPLGELWRLKQIQYTWLRTIMGQYEPFETLTAEALDYALQQFGIEDDDLRHRLMASYRRLSAYDDVAPVLNKLCAAGLRTAILSNGSPEMLHAAVANAGLDEQLDAVLSVDPLKVYKPDARVYQLACDHFGLKPSAICFLSSNGWDAAGASSFGFKVAWINRAGLPVERLPGQPAATLDSMADLPDLLGLAA